MTAPDVIIQSSMYHYISRTPGRHVLGRLSIILLSENVSIALVPVVL